MRKLSSLSRETQSCRLNWTLLSTASRIKNSVTVANGIFFGISPGNAGTYTALNKSTDFYSWTNILDPVNTDNFNPTSIIWTGSEYVIAGYGEGSNLNAKFYSSSDLINFTPYTQSYIGRPSRIVSSGSKYFCGTQFTTGGFTWTSTGGFTAITIPNQWTYDAAYGNGYFVAVGRDATTSVGRISYSTNASTWTNYPNTFTDAVSKVVFANGMFVALTAGNQVYYSTTPSTWTLAGTFSPAAYIGYLNNLWVLLTLSYVQSTPNWISTDGITWNRDFPSFQSSITGFGNQIVANSGKFYVQVGAYNTLGIAASSQII